MRMARRKRQIPPKNPLPGREMFANEQRLGVMPVKVLYEILKEIMPNCPSYPAIHQAVRRAEEKLRKGLEAIDC